MLSVLVKRKKPILLVYSVILLALWLLTLLFHTAENKVMILILSLVIPFVVYGFVRLMYKVVSIHASLGVLRFFYYFFLIGGFLGTVMLLFEFVFGFPNGLSPTLGACGALVVATLDSARKVF